MNGNTIYHVCFGDDNHHYFGSVAAIYDKFTPLDLGVSKSRLWAYGITETHPYRNAKCIIYRGKIRRKRMQNTAKRNKKSV